VQVLEVFETEGSKKAKELIDAMSTTEDQPIARELIAIHGLMAAMKGQPGKFVSLVSLTSYAKGKATEQ